MSDARIGFCAVLGVGALVALYYATQNDGSRAYVPKIQGEAQFMGLSAGLALNENTPLDLRTEVHFWSPGINPRDKCDGPVVKCKVRYPVAPGGNISYLMHKGWGSFCADAPAGNDWFSMPPSAAVL